ncbi:MAG: hypothetical protein EPN89_04200, partial [Methylovulum sp.]
MPYMAGFTDDVEKAWYLRKYDVTFPALSYVFGHSPMYWYRLENHLGRYSLVGTTLHKNTGLPQHLVADEKHTSLAGEKCYVATTVANNCILGVSVAKAAGEIELTKAYGVFAEEAKRVEADYKPKTVNTDGWPATQKAWQTLFSTVLIICCFLHIFIKIRDRAKMKFHDIYLQATTKLWDCYRATTKQSFSQRIRRLAEWCSVTPDVPAVISEPIKKLSKNLSVNWCEITTHATDTGKVLYRNAFATSLAIDGTNVAAVVASGRARWKIENENNNTLKTKGYHFEHNYGHGKQFLSSLLATLILLAYLLHTLLDLMDDKFCLLL